MSVAFLATLALLAAQPPEDDGPVQTAPREAPVSELDEPAIRFPSPPAEQPQAKAEPPTPGPVAPAVSLAFQPRTLVDGATLQVVRGQRAVFRLDDKGQPVLGAVEEGQLAAAHPDGAVAETFAAPSAGQLAAAFDASAEKRTAVLKVWNGLAKSVDYRAVALVYRGDKLTPMPVTVCAVPPGGVRTETWPAPIVAVGLGRFTQAVLTKACK